MKKTTSRQCTCFRSVQRMGNLTIRTGIFLPVLNQFMLESVLSQALQTGFSINQASDLTCRTFEFCSTTKIQRLRRMLEQRSPLVQFIIETECQSKISFCFSNLSCKNQSRRFHELCKRLYQSNFACIRGTPVAF